MRVPEGRAVGGDDADGSLLVEALIGIALLGAAIATAAQLLVGVAEAGTRAAGLVDAVRIGERAIELGVIGSLLPEELASEGSVAVEVMERGGDGGLGCAEDLADDVGEVVVRARYAGRVVSRQVDLVAVHRSLAAAEDGGQVRLRLTSDVVPAGTGTSVRIGTATGTVEQVDGTACAVLDGVAHGTYDVIMEGAVALVDPTHVPVDMRPQRITVTDSRTERDLDVAPAGLLRIDIGTDGARQPDVVASGGLRWFVRGDDMRTATALGGARAVHPGPVTAVVSACLDPEAFASSATFQVVGDAELVGTVPLATVTFEGVAGRTDASVLAIRTTGCADGSGLRPSLRWDGGLADGMRVALPHGEWEARLQTASGSPLTFPVLFHAGEPDLVATFP